MTVYRDYMLESVLSEFNIPGKIIKTERFGNGYINDTFLVHFDQNGLEKKYIFRKINKFVFNKPVEVIENTVKVIKIVSEKLLQNGMEKVSDHVLQIIESKNHKFFVIDTRENYWCTFRFIENSYTIEIVESSEQAYQAAKTFGKFQSYLIDSKLEDFHTTIPNFHNLTERLNLFEKAVRNNPKSRVDKAKKEINLVNKFDYLENHYSKLLSEKIIPTRITHNDAKIDNVLMNKNSGKGQCVIDLDTVMPGLVIYDFGDMVRTFTNPLREDDKNVDEVIMRMNIFESLTKGYLEELAKDLQKPEIDNLVWGAIFITYEQAVRYLTDYLLGDKYYTIGYENQNLIRARNQLKLLDSIIKQKVIMEEIVKQLKIKK